MKQNNPKIKLGDTKFIEGKLDMPKMQKIEPGCTKFVREQHEEGVEQKVKGASETSLWYVHKSKSPC